MLIWRLLPEAEGTPRIRNWRVWAICALEAAMAILLLTLLWEPAITVAELKSQQNIIAVLMDDSRSMGIADAGTDGKTARETAAVKALEDGVLPGLAEEVPGAGVPVGQPLDAGGEAGPVESRCAGDAHQCGAAATGVGDGGPAGGRGGAVERWGSELGRDRSGDDHAAAQPQASGAYDRLRQEKAAHDLEIDDVAVGAKAMAGSRMTATVSFHQRGYAGQKTTLEVKDGDKLLAAKDVTLAADGTEQSETMFFNAGDAGVKSIGFALEPFPSEESAANNAVTRLVDVSSEKRRILYVEGEPRWEYKFIRRGEDDDKGLQVVSMLRTTENKIYRQGISDPSELADGFPTKAEDLFKYDGIIIGSVEAGYFSPVQQELLREFVDRRGGGILFLGGRFSLGDGGWATSGAADLLPTFLPAEKGTFHRDAATVELTAAGAESPITRLLDDRARMWIGGRSCRTSRTIRRTERRSRGRRCWRR